MADNTLVKLIEIKRKQKEANNKLRAEILKARVQSALRTQESRARIREQAAVNQEKDRRTNPQRYTPEQEYLRRRVMEENPLMQMMVPEEGQNFEGIGYPTSVVQPEKGGMMEMKSTQDPQIQRQLLRRKVEEMMAQGKKPHPVILKLLGIQEAQSQRQSKEHRDELASLQRRLDFLGSQIYHSTEQWSGKPKKGHEARVAQLVAERDELSKRVKGMMNPMAQAEEFQIGEERTINEKTYVYIGNDQWEES